MVSRNKKNYEDQEEYRLILNAGEVNTVYNF